MWYNGRKRSSPGGLADLHVAEPHPACGLVGKHALPPLGLPQRSAGLATTGQFTSAICRFFLFSAARPVAGRPKRGKTANGSRGVAFLVANPSLHRDKPGGGELAMQHSAVRDQVFDDEADRRRQVRKAVE